MAQDSLVVAAFAQSMILFAHEVNIQIAFQNAVLREHLLRQISTNGADFVRWSADDREIFFTNRTKLMAAPVRVAGDTFEVGTPKLLFEMRVDCSILEISCFDRTPDGKRFLVIEPVGSQSPVALVQNWTATLKK